MAYQGRRGGRGHTNDPVPSGATIPVLGMGTWHLGSGRHPVHEEIAALRLGLDLGMTLVDTAEMYGDGASERLLGRAIAGRREEVFLVSKVMPQHATTDGRSPPASAACAASAPTISTSICCTGVGPSRWHRPSPASRGC